MKPSHRSILCASLVVLIAGAAFCPVVHGGFTNWDDPDLVINNTHIKSLSSKNVVALFSASYGGFGGYTPLVFLSYALEYRLFGLNPKAFHITNLVLHIVCSLLVLWLVTFLSGHWRIGFVTAALFAVHPLHAEAVAWIQGRKDLLFSLFFLCGLVCYGLFLKKKPKKSLYVMALLFFVLSLFSKVSAISMPLVLLALEYGQRRKLDRRSLARVMPFLLLSLLFLALALITAGPETGLFRASQEHRSLPHNLGLFFYAFAFYISKFFAPARLYARYSAEIGEYPGHLVLNLAVFAVACLVFYGLHRRNRNQVVSGMAFFVLTLMPTLFFHFVGQPYADRYMYLPILGLLMIVVPFIDSALSIGPPRVRIRLLAGALLSGVLILGGVQSWRLSKIWQDSVSLWSEVIRNEPRNATAYLNRSEAYGESDQLDRALADLSRAEEYRPWDPNVPNNRGIIFFKKGEYEKALKEYNRALAISPRYYNGYLNRGTLWSRFGDYDKAIKDYSMALELDPRSYDAHFNRGVIFKKLKRPVEAVADFEAAFRISPTEQARNQIRLLQGQKDQKRP